MTRALDNKSLDTLFREARTHRAWQERDVGDDVLHSLYDLLKFGPTSNNCCPARFVFVKSPAAKERLKPHIASGNVEKTMTAPVTVIIGHDMKFYEKMPKLVPHDPNAGKNFVGKDSLIVETAFRNGSLQGAYLMLAARSLGLDCGPMSGFDAAGVKNEFFAGQDVEVNFLCNLGYGDAIKVFPRSPRLTFDEAGKIV